MKTTLTLLLLAFTFSLFGQDIPTQISDALETPDTSVLVKAYSKRYYVDSAGQIANIQAVRSDMQYFILGYIPSRYVGQEIEFLEPDCSGNYTESTFLNTGGELFPICFYYRLRQPNTPPMNPTDSLGVDVYYKVKVKTFWTN